jgi:hypothetical protein
MGTFGDQWMAYRVIFWLPKDAADVMLPATQPLGEKIRAEVLSGQHSEFLQDFPAQEMLEKLQHAFNGSHLDAQGRLHWSDEIDNGFVIRCGEQYVEVCAFDLSENDLDKIFFIAEEFSCEHYDWGN